MAVTTEDVHPRCRPMVLDAARRGRGVLACLAAGPVGAVVFVAVFVVQGAVRPDYDALVQPVSALALGPHGWVQDAAFVGFAVCVACFGYGLWARMRSGVGARSGPLTLAVTAACLVVLAVCRQDPTGGYPLGSGLGRGYSMVGLVHIAASALVAVLLVVHCALMALRFRRTTGAGRFAVVSAVAGVAGAGLVVAYVLSCMSDGPSGLFERGAVVVMGLHGLAVARWFARPRVAPVAVAG